MPNSSRSSTRYTALAAAALVGACAPGVARAGDLSDLADVADQIVADAGAGASTATPSAVDVAGTVDRAMQDARRAAAPSDASRTLSVASAPAISPTAALAVADAVVDGAPVVSSPRRAHGAAPSRRRARWRLRAGASGRVTSVTRTSGGRAAAIVRAASRAAVRVSPTPTHSGAAPERARGASRDRHLPPFPGRLPPLPLFPETTSSAGGGFSAGALLPPLIAALGGLVCIFAVQLLTRRVPVPRPPRPRRVSLPPWRPG